MSDRELVALLREQAAEIAAADLPGWGNTMLLAADRIEKGTKGGEGS